MNKGEYITLEAGNEIIVLKVVDVKEKLTIETDNKKPTKTEPTKATYEDIESHDPTTQQNNTAPAYNPQDIADFKYWSSRLGIWGTNKEERAKLHQPYLQRFFSTDHYVTFSQLDPANYKKYVDYLKSQAASRQ